MFDSSLIPRNRFPLGPDKGAYYHPDFNRDAPDLARAIQQVDTRSKSSKAANANPGCSASTSQPPNIASSPGPAFGHQGMPSTSAITDHIALGEQNLWPPVSSSDNFDTITGPQAWQQQHVHEHLQPLAQGRINTTPREIGARSVSFGAGHLPSSSHSGVPSTSNEPTGSFALPNIQPALFNMNVPANQQTSEQTLNDLLVCNRQRQMDLLAQEQQHLGLEARLRQQASRRTNHPPAFTQSNGLPNWDSPIPLCKVFHAPEEKEQAEQWPPVALLEPNDLQGEEQEEHPEFQQGSYERRP